jgi:hypothetical protein
MKLTIKLSGINLFPTYSIEMQDGKSGYEHITLETAFRKLHDDIKMKEHYEEYRKIYAEEEAMRTAMSFPANSYLRKEEV